jgi:P27 family predicted phage terminase small subunit
MKRRKVISMARRGPKKQTFEERKAAGKVFDAEKIVKPMPGLSKTARAEWKRVAPTLHRLGLLTDIDRTALAGYCESFAMWIDCHKILQKEGYTVTVHQKNRKGEEVGTYYQQRPEVKIADMALGKIRDFCNDFGMNPTSRGKMTLPGEDENSKVVDMLD